MQWRTARDLVLSMGDPTAKREEAARRSTSSSVCGSETYRDKGDWPRFFRGANMGDGGSHPQAKTKSGEEEWECKQTADTTQLQKHGNLFTFGKCRGATLREVYENDLSYCQ